MLYALPGLLFGVVGGMGLGGGIVLIPALTLLLGQSQHAAQGMTLFAYLPMACTALFTHVRQKNLRIKSTLWLTLIGCAGGAAGFFLAAAIEAGTLRTVFAAFLLAAAALRAWRYEIQPRVQKRRQPGAPRAKSPAPPPKS